MSLYTAALQQLYVAYFSRPADVAGLAYWETIVTAANGDIAQVAAAFAASAEYRSVYAGKDAAQVVDTVYLHLFGRHAEPGGLEYWAPLLASGAISIGAVVRVIAAGAQSTDLVAYNAKVAAAVAFTAALDTSAEILAYSGADANAAAAVYLAAVTDADTLAAAIGRDRLDATVFAITNPGATATLPVPLPVPTPIVPPKAQPGGRTINLGAGDDKLGNFNIVAGDVVDGGPGTDTMALEQVGSANASAFWNFERLEAGGPGSLDMNLLLAQNKIAEIVVSGETFPYGLFISNLGAATAVRVRADQVGLELTLANRGPLSLTADRDEGATAPTGTGVMSVNVYGASSVDAVFDSDFELDRTGQLEVDGGPLNGQMISLYSDTVQSVSIVSGGDFATNFFTYFDAGQGGSLTAISVSGSQHLNILTKNTAKLALVDASVHTGGLSMATGRLADGGVIRLGEGTDAITLSSTSTTANPEALAGFEKTPAIALSPVAVDAATAIPGADLLLAEGARVADATGGTYTGVTLNNGVLGFLGMGPATLAEAFALAGAAAESVGEALVFEYLGNSYVFVQGESGLAVKLVGTTGIVGLGQAGEGSLFIV